MIGDCLPHGMPNWSHVGIHWKLAKLTASAKQSRHFNGNQTIIYRDATATLCLIIFV